ncbi:MAG: aminoacyl-histidine dipeptidase [bacterium]
MSKEAIEGLQPQPIWNYFYDITQVPRPSKKEEKIRKHIVEFAKAKNFQFKEDAVGNILIFVPATQGYESAPTIVLQGHLDMVCEMNKGTVHDFENDPLKIRRDGDWIAATGTTLGADNGIGVAGALAIATDETAVHGPLELFFTIDEETGMTGVNELQPGFFTGKTLLNMDSEEDGVFYIGCSGGVDTVGTFRPKLTKAKKKLVPFDLMITGLKGGHSGLDIQRGRANAIKLLARLLNQLEEYKFQLASISGGSKRNAIPREAEAVILIKKRDAKKIQKVIDQFVADALLEYAKNDGGLKVVFEQKEAEVERVFKKGCAEKFINVLLSLPHGVLAMSPDIPELVETSTNCAIVTFEDEELKIATSQRSSIEAAKVFAKDIVVSVLKLAEADDIEVGDGYPGWKPNMDSGILKTSMSVFKEIFGKEPQIKAIHAGLETGLLGAKYPGLDMISFGPTIQGAHSPDEKLNIKDVEKFYTLLKGILAELAKTN